MGSLLLGKANGGKRKGSNSEFKQASVREDGAGTRDRTEDTSLEGWGFTTKLCPHGKADYHYLVDGLGQVVIACLQDKSNVLATLVVLCFTAGERDGNPESSREKV